MKLPENTILSTVIHRELLSQKEDEKSVYLLRLSVPETLLYEPGDVVFICPRNNPKWVEQALDVLKVSPDAEVLTEEGLTLTLEEALTSQYELRLRPSVLDGLPPDLQDDFWQCLGDLRNNSGPACSASQALTWLKPMRPRAYSIASAKIAHPTTLDVVVGLVTYRDVKGGICEGLSSGFLCKRLQEGMSVQIYIKPSRFRLPDDPTRPVIMVGPGTGIAPFKAFLEHRDATQSSGPNWLFFGGRHRLNDFILKDFLENLQQKHVLTRLDLAFSRDQEHKIYVQDRMKANAKELWNWFRQGAYFYICGDAKHMAKDVEATLLSLIQDEEHLSLEEAQIYLKDLRLASRYQKDVY